MNIVPELEELGQQRAPLEMQPGEFRTIGDRLVDPTADRLIKLPDGPVMLDESPADVQKALGAAQTLEEYKVHVVGRRSSPLLASASGPDTYVELPFKWPESPAQARNSGRIPHGEGAA